MMIMMSEPVQAAFATLRTIRRVHKIYDATQICPNRNCTAQWSTKEEEMGGGRKGSMARQSCGSVAGLTTLAAMASLGCWRWRVSDQQKWIICGYFWSRLNLFDC